MSAESRRRRSDWSSAWAPWMPTRWWLPRGFTMLAMRRQFDRLVSTPVDGAVFVRDEGFPAVVVSLVAYHTGAVFEARERGLLDALAEFTAPPSLLLDVLTCADLTTGPQGSPVRAEDRVTEILSRYPPDGDPVHRAIERAAPSLLAAAARVSASAG